MKQPIPLHDKCKEQLDKGNRGVMCEQCRVNVIIEEWILLNHPPAYVLDFLRRGENEHPLVTLKAKKDYIQSHSLVKGLVKELSEPHKITKVSSIEEAMDISLKDIKKGAQ